ncbi:low affinity immunoglobulin gamma Fc region receptor III-like isoform X2 [Anabas testudineus]|uniref:Ig-like domain-containing protein n=1 Tax=Anabas testudineus TaxID=64144 RepID=A0AAQ6IUL1_ANATE|nr:low affinity immunoglobulin gamma Fc region receptor III-like isoform X2 [Anabas testudineus]
MFSQQQDNMEVTALCIKLLMILMFLLCEHNQNVNAASFLIKPNRAQFFVYDSITFHCEGVSYCDVEHKSKGKIESCNKTNRRTSTGSSCTIMTYPADSGEYWFNAGGGERSNSVDIVVTAGSVILEIPALPVMEGEAVTLTCRNKTTSSQTSADFYNYGVFINSSSTGNKIFHSVSKSDEGLYKCSIPGAGESAESRLIIRDGQKETPSSSSSPWIIATVLLLVLLVLVGLLQVVKGYWHRVMFYMSTLRSGSGSAANQTDENKSTSRAVYYTLSLDDTQQLEPAVPASLAVTNLPLTEDALYSTIQ